MNTHFPVGTPRRASSSYKINRIDITEGVTSLVHNYVSTVVNLQAYDNTESIVQRTITTQAAATLDYILEKVRDGYA